jgi:hypothetical protein
VANHVRAEIKGILLWVAAFDSPTIDEYEPDDSAFFGFNAQIFIGEVGNDLYDSFDICVCSPSWFAAQVKEGAWERFRNGILREIPESIAIGSYFWFMRSWNRSDFDLALQSVCEAYSPAKDWGTLASRLGRVIPWEYAYRYDTFLDEHFGDEFPPVGKK